MLAEVLAALSAELEPLDARRRVRLARPVARAGAVGVGRTVECDTPRGRVAGIASGIADDGALLVRVGNGWSA